MSVPLRPVIVINISKCYWLFSRGCRNSDGALGQRGGEWNWPRESDTAWQSSPADCYCLPLHHPCHHAHYIHILRVLAFYLYGERIKDSSICQSKKTKCLHHSSQISVLSLHLHFSSVLRHSLVWKGYLICLEFLQHIENNVHYIYYD